VAFITASLVWSAHSTSLWLLCHDPSTRRKETIPTPHPPKLEHRLQTFLPTTPWIELRDSLLLLFISSGDCPHRESNVPQVFYPICFLAAFQTSGCDLVGKLPPSPSSDRLSLLQENSITKIDCPWTPRALIIL
ncbi:hypothetical protein PTTG_26752, partial [Puccinia triticina 1-1 BBBD Race 1]